MRPTRVLLAVLAVCLLSRASLSQTSVLRLGRPAPNLHVAPNAYGFHGGGLLSTQDYDCLFFDSNGNPYYNVGFIVSAYVGYVGDPNSNPVLPKVGDVYYVAVAISNVAACQSAGVQPWLLLPGNTYLAISGTNPVKCFKNGVQVACSQNPQLGYSLSGAYGYNLGVWPDLKGGNVEIDVPVSTTSAVQTQVAVRVDTADGWSNPWITPSVSYPVGAGSNIPTITYPATSTDMITDTTARTHAILSSPSTTGTLYFDIGITANYDTSTAGASVPSPGTYNPYVDWSGLAPGTLYHWRARYTYGAGSTALGADQTFTTTGTASVPGVPQGFSATTASPTQVTLVWNAVLGATSYEIRRRGPSGMVLSYALVGTVTNGSTSYTDTTVTANNAYLYKVRAVNSAGASFYTADDLATTVAFTDDRLVEGVTVIKLAHLTQLRTAVNAVRSFANLAAGQYTDPMPVAGVTTVKAIHVTELRAQYDEAMGVLTGRNSSWATSPVIGGPISFVDFQQLRDRLK
jgi:hypothetical protein